MAEIVAAGATLCCSFGTIPCMLRVTSQNIVFTDGRQAATVQDCQAGINISSFGMCSSPANPQVQAATAAALGVLTPQPCAFSAAEWGIANAGMLADGKPLLLSNAGLLCTTGLGSITVSFAGQKMVTV